jgi:hypothetical protein
VRDLARWQDWEATYVLIELHDAGELDRPGMHRGIREFMRLCARSRCGEPAIVAAQFLDTTSFPEEQQRDPFANRLMAPQ